MGDGFLRAIKVGGAVRADCGAELALLGRGPERLLIHADRVIGAEIGRLRVDRGAAAVSEQHALPCGERAVESNCGLFGMKESNKR